MALRNETPRHSEAPVKGKSQLQDDSIMGTNNSSIVSKRSVERLYYPNEPHFFRYFVKKPQRRSPLINRGYWLRMRAVDHVVRQFLEQDSSKQKIVINLGCGYDPLPWQCLARYPAHCRDVKFIDVDYKDLMIKKRDTVCSTKELNSFLTDMEMLEDDVLLRSDQYLQIGCDLRDLKLLKQVLASAVDIENCLVLLTAEVSITYMNVEAADALIHWAAKLPDARFCLLEQILPDGIDHPFARTMMAHFDKLQTPLRAVQKYPTVVAQEERFKGLGWNMASACNLWRLWNDLGFINSRERISLDMLEPFDEWEEFALFGCHYFLLVADNTSNLPNCEAGKDLSQYPENGSVTRDGIRTVKVEMVYAENPKAQGRRRFAAVLPLRGSRRTQDRVGLFAGMGLNTRINTYDVYANNLEGDFISNSPAGSVVPSSRMCHTITDLGESGAILVGGRTSPDNALAECWLYHKWLDTWERVDDLPQPRYRHGAVNLGNGYILISPGKSNSRDISGDFYVWSRALGWTKCIQGPGENPVASYGATFTTLGKLLNIRGPTRGLLAGGMSEDALFLEDVWEWEILDPSDEEPIIVFKRSSGSQPFPATIARFGASVARQQDQTWIVGGIVKDNILTESTEVYLVDSQAKISRAVLSRSSSFIPRPLLMGSSVISTETSLLVLGGSAVCFSFGTFWNTGCYTIEMVDGPGEGGVQSPAEPPNGPWRFSHTVAAAPTRLPAGMPRLVSVNSIISVTRMRIRSSADFGHILRSAKPVILEGLNLGPCTDVWTSRYLKEQIGAEREIIVHEATTEHMNFQSKNFVYTTKPFGDFIDQIDGGGRLYLRSLSSEKPAELPADISRDYPSIAKDFRLPPELVLVTENTHSCPLRISGHVIMWLHYDVMANVLCQIRGSKRLLLFPPSDVKHLGFESGASSSSINVFDKLPSSIPANTHPHEALLNPGDVLFLPPLWLHTASPTSGMSVAVNVFFRNLESGYAAGKDVYGNRDLQAYDKGRQDIAKIIKSFDSLPVDVRGFYLQRLVKEFEENAC